MNSLDNTSSKFICSRCFIDCRTGDALSDHIDEHIRQSKLRKKARIRRKYLNEFKSTILNLIEQAKDKDLPLGWLTKQIKEL